jgi:cardiolipin synthase
MWDWVMNNLLVTMWDVFTLIVAFLYSNLFAVLGFILALLILGRLINEKRNPSNFFAWSFLIVFFPFVGVPLYFLFGGRKSRRLARLKREVQSVAEQVSAEHDSGNAKGDENTSTSNGFPSATEPGAWSFEGNKVELLADGESAFARLCEEIDRAQHRICIATYIFSKDATGLAVAEKLSKRAAEGVEVRVLVDALGSWNQTRAIRRILNRGGAKLARFMPVLPLQTHSSANLRNHRKVALFDDCRAITGGQNIDLRFLGKTSSRDRFTDFSILVEGPAVKALNAIFVSDWAFANKSSPRDDFALLHFNPPERGNSTIEVIASGPDMEGDPLWEQIIRMVQECRHSLTIVTPYFIPDEVLFQSLIVKAHTGRSIRLVLPFESNHKIVDIARYHFLRKLHAAGVEILFYKPRMLHAKLFLVDNNVAMLGSANIDMRSLFVNFEIGLFHYSKEDIRLLTEWTDNIVSQSVPFGESPRAQVSNRSKLAEDFVHLLAPML